MRITCLRFATTCAAATALAVVACASAAPALAHKSKRAHSHQSRVTVARQFKVRKPQVAGFVLRAGRISYAYPDTWRVPERADQGGPFDSGFFYDVPVTAIGSQAPYWH